jgi:penicillin-binding protein 1A
VVLLLILMVSGVTVASAAAITVGGAAGVTIATLDKGLPDVKAFRDLDYWEPTTLYTRDGKVQLAQFWEHRREVIDFDQIPPLVLDVITATEDDTFWGNPGIDLEATLRAVLTSAAGSDTGGASTITQQLVRARLLPAEVIEEGLSTKEGQYIRKAKEILQSYKLTQAFPGEDGKKDIITAYLNEIFFGQAYGIAAAADVYFGKDLNQLTVSEAALLAAIPQSPYKFDLYKNVKKEKFRKNGKKRTRLYIQSKCVGKGKDCTEKSELLARRNWILGRLKDGKGRWTSLSDEQYNAAIREKVVIKPKQSVKFKAPHFVNAVLPELVYILGDRDPYQIGGYKVTTTLDWRAQQLGEKFIYAGAVVPNLPGGQYSAAIKNRKLARDSGWISRLRGLNLRNGALVAQDYRTGDILAYVGSAGYYRKETPRFAPKVDHVGGSHRQPGSAWKPILYATGIDTERLTAGTYLLDQREAFGPGWTPQNADRQYRGLIRVREAIQQSLNIPAIRALQQTGITAVRRYAVKAGFTFLGNNRKMLDQAGLAGALGTVEVRPLDMTAAFGAFGNGGKVTEPRYILRVEAPDGEVIYQARKAVTTQVWSPQTAYIMADILRGNTNRAVNPAWGAVFELRNTRDGSRREAAVKTGTTNELKDYSTYGILPMPKKKNQPALAVGVWFGNSDSSSPNTGLLRYSLDNAGRTWAAFVREYTKGKPAPAFKRPNRVIGGSVYGSGGSELYISGTQPGGKRQVDKFVPKVTVTPAPGSSSSDDSSSSSDRKSERKPSPTCRPGFTDKPAGCVIPS